MKNKFVSEDIGLAYKKRYAVEHLPVECNVWKQNNQQHPQSLHKTYECQLITHKKEKVQMEVNTNEENDRMRGSHFARHTPECRTGRKGCQLD